MKRVRLENIFEPARELEAGPRFKRGEGAHGISRT
jgi:hypothetical protein